jgi:hypothetical protein
MTSSIPSSLFKFEIKILRVRRGGGWRREERLAGKKL